jgi:choline-sulfatase
MSIAPMKFVLVLCGLAANRKYAAKLSEMEALLLAEMCRLDDPWRLWGQPPDGRAARAK